MPQPPSELQIRKPEPVLARPLPRRPEAGANVHPSRFDRADILYALFKHKKKIIAGGLAGLVAAAVVYHFYPAVYRSDAKLLVRYLVERGSIDAVDNQKRDLTDAIIGSEVEILGSWDLATDTAEAIGPKRLLPDFKGTPSKEAAASVIWGGLKIEARKGTNIILVSYENRNPELATLVLTELVNRYFNKHLEVHRSAGAFDFVAQQTDQVRARLTQAEDALKDIKQKAGIMSLDNSTSNLNSEAQKVEDQMHGAEAEVAEARARLRQIGKSTGGVTVMGDDIIDSEPSPAESPHDAASKSEKKADNSKPQASASPSPTAPQKTIQRYEALDAGLGKMRKKQGDLYALYSPNSRRVKANEAQIDRTVTEMTDLEKQYPDLKEHLTPSSHENNELDAATESARLAGLQAKKDALSARLDELRRKMQNLAQVAPQIADLERQKQLEETNYQYFQATLEKARVDEALDPSKIPNISAVQHPSPPRLDTGKRTKVALGIAAGGFGLSIALVLFLELVLNARLQRPSELEKVIGVPLLMWIPYIRGPGSNGTTAPPRNGESKVRAIKPGARQNLAPWDPGHFIRPYSEAIRDRLGLYFELHHLTHKPKLVGVAGFSDGTGASTLAAGLAAALSETNDGKVLLVDASLGPDQVHPFFKGKPAYPLQAALRPKDVIDPAAENLYLAKVGSSNAGPAQLGLKKFFDLMPNLRASDFDYIIFDMPPLTQTSPTWGMAPFMDKMLVIVEAEKNNRDIVKRAYRRLVTDRDNVSLIVNKVRSYAPKRLELEET
jgi:uncharacterized protein involved in exopolysaccharide biosynthesis/Mrp family chromosome partitioning ATPase